MKWLLMGAVLFAVFLFVFCKSSGKRVQYSPKDNKPMYFRFKLNDNDTVFQEITLITTPADLKEGKTMFLQAYFQGQRIYAEKILSIDLKIFGLNSQNGKYEHEIPFNNTYVSSDFSSYYYYTYNVGHLNYTGNLNSLVIKADLNPENKINNFYINKELILKDYPKEIKAIIHVKWIGGEQEFTALLKLIDLGKAGNIRTNPFG